VREACRLEIIVGLGFEEDI
jgi:hypothetical protein